MNPNLLNTTVDIEILVEGYNTVRSFMAGSAWSDYIVSPFGDAANATTDEELEQFARNTAVSLSHVVGSAAMAPANLSAKATGGGVVNPDLTVKGTAGLRIIDASVMVSLYYSILLM